MATDSAAAAGSGSGGGSDIKPATASVARAGVSGGDLVVEMTTNPMRESASTRGDTTPRGPGQGAAAAASDETKEAPPHSISEKLNEWGAKFMGSAVTDDDGGRAKAEAAGGMTWAWWRARHFCTMVHKPGDGWRVKWDVAVVVVLVFCLIDIPIRVAFEQDTEPGSFGDVLNIMVDVFFLCDVLGESRARVASTPRRARTVLSSQASGVRQAAVGHVAAHVVVLTHASSDLASGMPLLATPCPRPSPHTSVCSLRYTTCDHGTRRPPQSTSARGTSTSVANTSATAARSPPNT